jgi:hypothetical protein
MAVKKIILKGEELCIRKESIAAEAITPGDLVLDAPSIGDVAGAISRQDASTAFSAKAVAYERELTGDGIDVDYAIGDTVLYAVCPPGTEVYLNGTAAITLGALVEAAADGSVVTRTTGAVVGTCIETSGGAGRVKVSIA